MQDRLWTAGKQVYHAIRGIALAPRARKVAERYEAHYREALALYRQDGREERAAVPSLSKVGVRVCAPGSAEALIELPANYEDVIQTIRGDVEDKLDATENCLFFPRLQERPAQSRTAEVPAVRRGEVIAVQLRDYRSVRGLEELCEAVLPEIERKVYGAYLIVDKVYIYRNLPSQAAERVSWSWHYDNHPVQVKKIMVYLTDVSEDTGPFEFFRSLETREGLSMPPRPLSGYSRISSGQIRRWLAEGFEPHKVTGARGTLLFFDENVVHKANVARRGFRDVVVFQIRPATFRPEAYISPEWTGSFANVDFSPDPWVYRPLPKPRILSG